MVQSKHLSLSEQGKSCTILLYWGSPEKQNQQGREKDQLIDILYKIDSPNYGDWEDPWSAICKPETQESQW